MLLPAMLLLALLWRWCLFACAGGDGPKKPLLDDMIKQEGLQGQVTLVGAVPHERARDFLLSGQIFVNASLTEAFCMAIVEAASVGLLVVSTKVGGVPEVRGCEGLGGGEAATAIGCPLPRRRPHWLPQMLPAGHPPLPHC